MLIKMDSTQLNKNKIKQIGENGICTEDELLFFLPNHPTVSGSEFIFKISWADAKRYLDKDVEYFVKGLHYIELKYRELVKNDFGFGSPSPTFKVIESLKEKDIELSKKLSDWVFENGGNYYLSK